MNEPAGAGIWAMTPIHLMEMSIFPLWLWHKVIKLWQFLWKCIPDFETQFFLSSSLLLKRFASSAVVLSHDFISGEL